MALANKARPDLYIKEQQKEERPYISIVIPIFREEEGIPDLYNRITEAMEETEYTYEVVAVDDGSKYSRPKDGNKEIKDKTLEALIQCHEHDPRWRVFSFRRNYGQTAAMSAGFDAARGDIVVTIDADLQNEPKDIKKLIEVMEEGDYDIVSGWRKDRKEPFFSRRLPSMLANGLISQTTNVRLHDYGCTLKAYRSEVVKNVRLYGELHRFIPALASWMGVQVAEVPVRDHERQYGKSNYGIGRTFRVILDLITVFFLLKFAQKPAHIFGTIGAISLGIGSVLAAYLFYVRVILLQGIGDRPLLMLSVLLIILGVQMLSIGLVAEMVMRNYHEPEGRPTYMVRHAFDVTEQEAEKQEV